MYLAQMQPNHADAQSIRRADVLACLRRNGFGSRQTIEAINDLSRGMPVQAGAVRIERRAMRLPQ